MLSKKRAMILKLCKLKVCRFPFVAEYFMEIALPQSSQALAGF